MVEAFYFIPPHNKVHIQKTVNLPDLPKYSGGEPGYIAITFDQSLTWDMNKSYEYQLCRYGEPQVVAQAPRYVFSEQATETHTLSR